MTNIIGGNFVSISHSGTAVFDQEISSVIGGVEVDLVSAPIPPGNYTMKITTGVGGVDIYLPAYVKFTVGGGAGLGGVDVVDGFDFFDRIGRKITGWVSSNPIPDHAARPSDPNAPVHVHFDVTRGVGGLQIHRLPVAET
jgi:hypothetical protein